MLCSCTNIDMPASGTTRGARAAAFLKRLVVVLGLATTLCPPSLLAQHSSVTAVEGDSVLGHLHRPFEETAMGKTWRLGPPLQAQEETADLAPSAPHRSSSTNTVVLHGADLYRMNCEGCHGESGLGAPPEIASIINPVRSTSVALVMQRMKSVGARVSRAQLIRKITVGASVKMGAGTDSLRGRMPVFFYLTETEAADVYGYLEAYPPSDSINPPAAVQVQNVQSAPTTGSARPPEGTRKRRDAEPADSANRTWFLYLSLGVLGLLAVGIVFTQREFRRLSTEAHMRRSLRTHLVARALPIVARQNNSWVAEKTSRRPIALVPTGRKPQASSAKRLKDWWCPEEFGDAC